MPELLSRLLFKEHRQSAFGYLSLKETIGSLKLNCQINSKQFNQLA